MNSKPPKPKHNGNGNASARRISARGPQIVNHKSAIVNPPSTINCCLARIQDWSRLAHDTKYSVTALAEHCKVCVRTLQSFFLYSMKEPPRLWINRLRMERAIELLRDGSNVNETADLLAYQNHGQFSRAFKRFYGFAPTKHANRRPGVR
jgi:AraC-like DNA-binding protein